MDAKKRRLRTVAIGLIAALGATGGALAASAHSGASHDCV
jgi:hypothetical protein